MKTPDPKIFRASAIAAANGDTVNYVADPVLRKWCQKALGHTSDFFFGYGKYEAPNHGRVLTFLWLELMAKQQR